MDTPWLVTELANKVGMVDFDLARRDVERFLQEPEARGLQVWSKEFFQAQIGQLERIPPLASP